MGDIQNFLRDASLGFVNDELPSNMKKLDLGIKAMLLLNIHIVPYSSTRCGFFQSRVRIWHLIRQHVTGPFLVGKSAGLAW